MQADPAADSANLLTFDVPRDHFIHEILLQVNKDTDGSLTDTLNTIQLVGNGNKYMKDLLASFCVNIQRMNEQRHMTGLYHIFFTDPHIPEAKPLPAWVFTSLQLKVLTVAGGAGVKNQVTPTIVESAYQGEDLSNWHILCEKYLSWRKYGANVGWQEYEHERAYKIFSYLYVQDDNGTIASGKFDKLKLLGRKPDGELTIVGEVPTKTLEAENKARIGQDLDAGFFFLQWANGFPTGDFSSLKSYLNIPTGGTNIGLRVVERYVL
jgi:hypothetical protein